MRGSLAYAVGSMEAGAALAASNAALKLERLWVKGFLGIASGPSAVMERLGERCRLFHIDRS